MRMFKRGSINLIEDLGRGRLDFTFIQNLRHFVEDIVLVLHVGCLKKRPREHQLPMARYDFGLSGIIFGIFGSSIRLKCLSGGLDSATRPIAICGPTLCRLKSSGASKRSRSFRSLTTAISSMGMVDCLWSRVRSVVHIYWFDLGSGGEVAPLFMGLARKFQRLLRDEANFRCGCANGGKRNTSIARPIFLGVT